MIAIILYALSELLRDNVVVEASLEVGLGVTPFSFVVSACVDVCEELGLVVVVQRHIWSHVPLPSLPISLSLPVSIILNIAITLLTISLHCPYCAISHRRNNHGLTRHVVIGNLRQWIMKVGLHLLADNLRESLRTPVGSGCQLIGRNNPRVSAVDNQMNDRVGRIGTATVFCNEMQEEIAGCDSPNRSVGVQIGDGCSKFEVFGCALAHWLVNPIHRPFLLISISRTAS